MSQYPFVQRILIISVLEHVLFKIGISDKRTDYFESVKKTINFSETDYLSSEYNRLVKSQVSIVLQELLWSPESIRQLIKSLIIGLINSDPYTSISEIGKNHIKRISDNIY